MLHRIWIPNWRSFNLQVQDTRSDLLVKTRKKGLFALINRHIKSPSRQLFHQLSNQSNIHLCLSISLADIFGTDFAIFILSLFV